MKNFLCALGLSLTMACTTAIVRPYVGEQQAWPTAGGAIVNARYALPIFTSLPPSPYEVLAELRASNAFRELPDESDLGALVKAAVKLDADALIFVDGQLYFGTTYGMGLVASTNSSVRTTITQVNRFNPDSFKKGVSIVAIRWTGEPPKGLSSHHTKRTPSPAEPPAKVEETPAPKPVAPTTNFSPSPAKQPPVVEEVAPPAAPAVPEPPAAE